MWHDLRYAVRALRESPGFTSLALLTLALGIGGNIAIFSLLHAEYLRLLPGVEEPRALIRVLGMRSDGPGYYDISYPDYLDYATSDAFSEVAASSEFWIYLDDGGGAREVSGSAVSANFFATLGLKPHRGRFFRPEEDAFPDAFPVAVLAYRLWQQRFEGDPEILGRSLWLNGVAVTVVGVAPPGFDGLYAGDRIGVWVPTALGRVRPPEERDRSDRALGWLDLIGRLAPEKTLADARTALRHRAALLDAAWPRAQVPRQLYVEAARGGHPRYHAITAATSTRLLAAVGLMLLIVCANLAGLLSARNALRGKEMAVRSALGASRGRLVRQLLTEGLVLALAGGVAGLLAAGWAFQLLGSFYPTLDPGFDPQVLAFALGVSLVTGIFFALLPATRATRSSLTDALKGLAPGSGRFSLRAAMITAQVALSLVLLTGAGLVLQSLHRLLTRPGFDAEGMVHFRLRPSRLGYDSAQAGLYHRQVLRRLEARPEVVSAVLARYLPMGGCCPEPIALPETAGAPFEVGANVITPGFLETLGIPLISGRVFDERDRPEGPAVVIINQSLAAMLWSEESPLGRILLIAGQPHEIVGVAADTHPARSGVASSPYLYRSFWQASGVDARLFVRVTQAPGTALRLLRQELRRVDPAVHIGQEMTLDERTRRSFNAERMMAQLLSVSGFIGLFLSAIGLYGALAFAVTARTREIGIRGALGARSADIVALVLGQTLRLTILGLLIGCAVAFWATRFLRAYLYGVEPGDPITFSAVVLLLSAVALAAGAVPAARALRIEPAQALRCD